MVFGFVFRGKTMKSKYKCHVTTKRLFVRAVCVASKDELALKLLLQCSCVDKVRRSVTPIFNLNPTIRF